MNSSENSSAEDSAELMAWEIVEKLLITFIIEHTHELKDVPRYVGLKAGALRTRIKKYKIPRPPKNHYEGPMLSQREMAEAFFASRASASAQISATLEVIAQSVNVPLAPPGGPIVNVPLSAVLPGQGARRRMEG